MKKTFILLAVFLGLVGARFAFNSAVATTTGIPFKLTPPGVALNTDDLDARDEFNRPVRSQVAKHSFEQLWSRNLSQLLLAGLTPARRYLRSFLETRWTNSRQFLVRFLQRARNATLALLPTGNALVRPEFSGAFTALPLASLLHRFGRTNFRSDLMVAALASIQILR